MLDRTSEPSVDNATVEQPKLSPEEIGALTGQALDDWYDEIYRRERETREAAETPEERAERLREQAESLCVAAQERQSATRRSLPSGRVFKNNGASSHRSNARSASRNSLRSSAKSIRSRAG